MSDFLKSKKNLINVLILLILILAIPLGMKLVQNQQILKSRAVEASVTFSGPNVTTRNNKTILKLDADGNAKVDLIITAPNAPGTQPTTTPGLTSAVSPTPSPTGVSPSSTPTP